VCLKRIDQRREEQRYGDLIWKIKSQGIGEFVDFFGGRTDLRVVSR
jgi:hypothetical protein